MPVIFKPMPPVFLGRPRRAIELPTIGFFPQVKQIFIITPVLEGLTNAVAHPQVLDGNPLRRKY